MEEIRLGNIKEQEDDNTSVSDGPTTCSGHMVHWLGYTSAHGFERVQDSFHKKSTLRIIFWFLVILGAFSMFAYQGYGLMTRYLNRPVNTKISINYETSAKFPAVTICNLNMIRKSRLPKEIAEIIKNATVSAWGNRQTADSNKRRRRSLSRQLRDVNSAESVSTVPPSLSPSWSQSWSPSWSSNYYSEEKPNDASNACIDAECFKNENATNYEESLRNEVTYMLSKYNQTELEAMGHQFYDLVFECKWSEVNCLDGELRNYWIPHLSLTYGSCYTFNGGMYLDQKALRLSKAGSTYGLSLKLNIEQSEYVEMISPEAGARITIGSRGSMPFPANEGFSVPPGMSSSIGLQTTYIKKVDPFGNKSCMNAGDLAEDNIYFSKHGAKYSVEACLKGCVAENMYETCGCTTYNFPNEEQICDPHNKTTENCTSHVYKQFLNSDLSCHEKCRQLCASSNHDMTVSTSVWPSEAQMPKIKEKMLASDIPSLKNYSSEAIRKNLMEVEVFFNDLSVLVIEEELAYTWDAFIADIGGLIGLYIGVSALTVIEFLELIFVMLFSTCARKNKTTASVIVRPFLE